MKLDRNEDLKVLYQVCVVFFLVDWKIKMAVRLLIGGAILDFSSETAEGNLTKLDRKQDLNVLNDVCLCLADRKTKMALRPLIGLDIYTPATKLGGVYWNHHVRSSVRPSVRPAAFGFPAHNCFPFTPIIMKLHMQTPHEARMCPIDFEVKRSKVKVTMEIWISWKIVPAGVFVPLVQPRSSLTTPLEPLNGIKRNLTGRQISTSSIKIVIFRVDQKNKKDARALIDWDIFNFSYETAERNLTELDSKADLNVLFKVWVFRADRKTKMATLADPSLYSGARYVTLWAPCFLCFWWGFFLLDPPKFFTLFSTLKFTYL